jgi:hypothetical protein
MNIVMVLLRTDPIAPVVIWAVLMLLAAASMVLLFDPPALRQPLTAAVDFISRPYRSRASRQEEAVTATRYADEIQTASVRAQDAARRWQEAWERAEQATEDAWHAWRDADHRLVRLRAAGAFAPPAHERTPVEDADRARFLRYAVQAAAGRGDLPPSAVADAAAGQGWDPLLHPVEQEIALQRAVAEHRRLVHRQAAAAEESVRHDALLAAASRDGLRREADAAEARAARVRQYVPVREARPRAFGRRLGAARAA